MRPLAAIALVVVLSGCSTLGKHGAPTCSGARRAANPHGSVLAPATGAAPAAADNPAKRGCGDGSS